MSDPNSNKRPPDDSSVGSASKKPNVDDLKGSMRKEKINKDEAEHPQLNFIYDLGKEKWSIKKIPSTNEEGNKLLNKIGNKIDPILKEEWEEMEQMCKT